MSPQARLPPRWFAYAGFTALPASTPSDSNRDVARLTQEVVEHLTGLVDTDVEVTLEVQATNQDGFPDDIVRTVSENARTLHLLSHGFEER